MIPEVKIGPLLLAKCQRNAALDAQATAFQSLIEAASQKLGDENWPSESFFKYHIEIAEGNGVITSWGAIPNNGAASAGGKSLLANSMQVVVGINLFTSGAGFELTKINDALLPVEIAVLLLAHEIFHLSELDRMSRSQIPYGRQFIAFAQGIHPDFEETWKSAVCSIVEHLPVRRAPNPGLASRTFWPAAWKAADIATEACADITALLLARKIGCDLPLLTTSLVQLRQMEEAVVVATQLNASNHLPSVPNYQIGAFLAANIGLAQQDDHWAIRQACWASALDILIKDPEVPHEAKVAINAVKMPLGKAPEAKPLGKDRLRNLFNKKP